MSAATDPIPALLSSSSLALSVFALFYNSVRAELDEVAELKRSADDAVREKQVARAGRALRTVLTLFAVALLAAVALAPEAIPYVVEAIEDVWRWKFGDYEAKIAVFCIVALLWVPIAFLLLSRVLTLREKRKALRAKTARAAS